ncbi:MAG: CPBP family intramembrane metalloprotease, partial [Clostridiales bacterium]|nr:CPBP family intramembrane metalloprotease [Clostridiales bacterium]
MKSERVNLIRIVGLSVASCLIYTLLLGASYQYFYTAAAKLALFLAAPVCYYFLSKRGRLADLFCLRGDKKYIKISAWLGVAAFAAVITAFFALRKQLDAQMILDGLAKEGITKAAYPYVFVHIVVINALLEEVFFRGFVFLTLFRLGFQRFAYVFSSVLFALYHIAMM